MIKTIGRVLLSILFLLTPIPYVFKFSLRFQQSVIFGKWGRLRSRNLSNLEPYGFKKHEYLASKICTSDNIELGFWVIFKIGQTSLDNPKIDTIIYIHGSSFDRDKTEQINLYKVLRKNFHIITFDYRGFGDSSSIRPTEEGVLSDTINVLKWVKCFTKSKKIHVWGHSLGGAIAIQALSKINDSVFQKVILESTFNNLRSEIPEHNYGKHFKNLPIFDYFITEPLSKNGKRFPTDKKILAVNSSFLILHTQDDDTIPLHLALELFNYIRNIKDVYMIIFDQKFKFNHDNINKYFKINNIILDFINNEIQEQIQVIPFK